MKRAVLYMRVSSVDQHPETQLHRPAPDGRPARLRDRPGVHGPDQRREGAPAGPRSYDGRRPPRTASMWSWSGPRDRIARSTRHFLEVLDELNRLNIEFVCFRENIDTGGPLGRAIVVIIGAIAELERNLIVERVRAGMRRARLEGRHIGRQPLELDREAILRDRRRGQSLRQIASYHRISTATVRRVLKDQPSVPMTPQSQPSTGVTKALENHAA